MKISHNWLKQYVDHSWSAARLADALTMSGLEVESVVPLGVSYDDVVVGEVLEVARHPNADRLTVCRVDSGGDKPLQVVCGAPNVAAGQKVPLARVGATVLVPDRDDQERKVPLEIKRTKIRGERSEGMICAEDELGLSEDHSGILILSGDAPVGMPFGEYLESRGLASSDYMLDVSITPNRPDAVSHIGVARDVAALSGRPLTRPEVSIPEAGGDAASKIAVQIDAPDGCGRYTAVLVEGLTIAESPAWLRQRLTAIGLRPRNNVVDITNFVMHECGQPLHAFDMDRVAGNRIVVRKAAEGEMFVTLDSKRRTLRDGTLLICDAERPVAIAGIMGGEDSEVTPQTVNVLIESAYFDPSTIRRGSKRLGLQTDSSYRFERGVDPDGTVWAAMRAAELMAELAGGTIIPGMVDAHPAPVERRRIGLRPARIAAILGTEIPADEAGRLLEAIGFSVEETEGVLQCEVPTFRPDVEREIDLIEEVARLYGFGRIPEPAHTHVPFRPVRIPAGVSFRRRAREVLAGAGFRDIHTNTMLRRDVADQFAHRDLNPIFSGEGAVQTLNPISQEMAALRPSLLPGVLQVISHNQNHGQRELRLSEFGHVFQKASSLETTVPGYEEHEALILAVSGAAERAAWDRPARMSDLFDLKGAVSVLFSSLKLERPAFHPADESPFFEEVLRIELDGAELGRAGRLASHLQERFELTDPVFAAEIDWDQVVRKAEALPPHSYRPVSRFPVVERDIALVVARGTNAGNLLNTIRTAGGDLLKSTHLFDLYEGEGIGAGRKSLAFSLTFGADRTLVDEEVDESVENILSALRAEHAAELRQ